MNNLILSVFLFLVVVCPMQAQRVVLPIGEQAVTEAQWRDAGSGGHASITVFTTGGEFVGGLNTTVSGVDQLKSLLTDVLWFEFFTPKDQECRIEVDTYVGSGTNVASRMTFESKPFRLVGGKIPPSVEFASETDIACAPPKLEFGSTVAVWAPDVRWIEDGLFLDDLNSPFFTRNGWQTNCWASELWGNGWIYFQGDELSGRQLELYRAVDGPGVGQYYILWYDESRTVGDRWDIGTGQWTAVGYSPTPKMVLRFDKDGNILVGATGATPGTTYAIGASGSIGGTETVIGTSTAGYDGTIAVYTPFDRTAKSKFFTIRPSRAGDPSPQPTSVPLGASFP